MTFNQVVQKVILGANLDLDSDVDLSNETAVAEAVMFAAKEVSRKTYSLFDLNVPLTITAGTATYDTIGSVTTRKVFDIRGVHVKGNWLPAQTWEWLVENSPSYTTASNAVPYCYVLTAPSNMRLVDPPNTATANATDNFVIGYCLHDEYVWTTQNGIELQGPADFHDLVVDQTILNITRSYASDQEGYARRAEFERHLETKAAKLKHFNLQKYTPLRRAAAGNTRRIVVF